MKYAFTFSIYRHVDEFWGPFDSFEKLMLSIENLIQYDDAGFDDRIADAVRLDEMDEFLDDLGIRIYQVSEGPELDRKDIEARWKRRVEERERRFQKQSDEHERAQYERLKKKFED